MKSGEALLIAVACASLLVAGYRRCAVAEEKAPEAKGEGNPMVMRDVLWVWGNPEMAEEGAHDLGSFAQAGPAERAQLLGVDNIVMAGYGLPHDEQEADACTKQVAGFPHLVWEIGCDDEGGGPPFEYAETLGRIRRLADAYPQIEGVLVDDMSTVKIDRGFKPEHLRQIQELLSGEYGRLNVWGVLYTMTLDREGIQQYIDELDVINLWTWHAKDVVDIEKNVAECERRWPGKPIVLGLYLYDYGQGRRMPPDLLETQCATALELAHAGRIQGIVLLTINNDREALAWTANWIARVGGQKIGARP